MSIVLKKKNFAKSILASSLAINGTSFTITTGEGALFPATGSGNPFRAVLWASDKNSPFQDANREIIECYISAADTITITARNSEGTSAKAWAIGDQFMLTLTTGTIDEIETEIGTKVPLAGGTMTGGLVLVAGSTTVQPLKMTSGVLLTTPVAGVCEYSDPKLYFTIA